MICSLGFILQGRDENDIIIGTFRADDDGNFRLMQCKGVNGSSVTHINADLKTQVKATWEFPQDFNGPSVNFRAVVVYRYTGGQKLNFELKMTKLKDEQ